MFLDIEMQAKHDPALWECVRPSRFSCPRKSHREEVPWPADKGYTAEKGSALLLLRRRLNHAVMQPPVGSLRGLVLHHLVRLVILVWRFREGVG